MKVKHIKYGIGNAIEPFENNKAFPVEFKDTTKLFLYPTAFTAGTLVVFSENASKNTPNTDKEIIQKDYNNLNNDLNCILKDYIYDYNRKKELPFVVKNSIPIVWFGDVNKYSKSAIKIVTVGLNPSEQEFMCRDSNGNMVELLDTKKRFDIINFENITVEEQIIKLKQTLNNYFYINPYKWFNKYEKLLNILDCSYKSSFYKNISIHIDIYSAIATSPTIGKLNENEKNLLKNFNLFKRLLGFLKPDIILISTNKQVFSEQFPNAKIIASNKFSGNNYINVYRDEEKLIFHGTNMQGIPFGGINESLTAETLLKYFEKPL